MDFDVTPRELGAFDTASLSKSVLDQEDVVSVMQETLRKRYPMVDRIN